MNPLVSIVIPAYNHERYIRKTVKSALNQTYKNIEVIIINDGSTDSTDKICIDLASKNQAIKYYFHENMGAHNTLNKGISIASGEYIAILNSDDIFYTNKIERCIEIVNKNKAIQFITGSVKFINENDVIQTKGTSVDWQKRAHEFYHLTKYLPISCLNENFMATTSNMFFSKSLWKHVGQFNALRYCHDLDFMMAAYRNCAYYYDENTFHIQYRVHSQNTIKEDISKVMIELSAVIASSLVIDNMNLLCEQNIDTSKFFNIFLNNKNISNILIYMMMYYLSINDRKSFFDNIYNNNNKEIFYNLIK